MCNVFKYNNYYPNEYIPIDPQKYIENNNIGNNSSANSEKFRKYVSYLTSTYKSNIYKINSYITTVNKMVDKIVAICDYIIYDNDNTIVQGADINYNIIYDKYQRSKEVSITKCRNFGIEKILILVNYISSNNVIQNLRIVCIAIVTGKSETVIILCLKCKSLRHNSAYFFR